MGIKPNSEVILLKDKLEKAVKLLDKIGNEGGITNSVPFNKKEIELLLHGLSYLCY